MFTNCTSPKLPKLIKFYWWQMWRLGRIILDHQIKFTSKTQRSVTQWKSSISSICRQGPGGDNIEKKRNGQVLFQRVCWNCFVFHRNLRYLGLKHRFYRWMETHKDRVCVCVCVCVPPLYRRTLIFVYPPPPLGRWKERARCLVKVATRSSTSHSVRLRTQLPGAPPPPRVCV